MGLCLLLALGGCQSALRPERAGVNVDALIELASVHREAKRFDLAMPIVLSAMDKAPRSTAAHIAYAELLADQGDRIEADRQFAKHWTDSSAATHAYGRFLSQQSGEDARADDALEMLAQAAADVTYAKRVAATVDHAALLMTLERWVAAERTLARLLDLAPDHREGSWMLVECYLQSGQYGRAQHLHRSLSQRFPGDARGRELAARLEGYRERMQLINPRFGA